MKKNYLIYLVCLASVFLFCNLSLAAQITPIGITGYGSYNNSEQLIIDNYIPPNWTHWQDSNNVWWLGTSTYFVIDFGSNYDLTSIVVSLDNNDSYSIGYSMDNYLWGSLLNINSWDGEVNWGMETFTVPVSATARYLRLEAFNGDNLYAVGELQAFGSLANSPVPEPMTMALFGIGLLGTGYLKKRKEM